MARPTQKLEGALFQVASQVQLASRGRAWDGPEVRGVTRYSGGSQRTGPGVRNRGRNGRDDLPPQITSRPSTGEIGQTAGKRQIVASPSVGRPAIRHRA